VFYFKAQIDTFVPLNTKTPKINNPNKKCISTHRRRWEDNIKMDLQEVGGGCDDWMELAQDRDMWRALVSTVKNP
jgi:hypothetical protein